MGASSFVSESLDTTTMGRSADQSEYGNEDRFEGPGTVRSSALAPHSLRLVVIRRLSSWSRSGAKRLFDCACVLPLLILLIPVLLAIALAVRLTSSGPVFFLQKRMGRNGQTFTILKFRSMIHVPEKAHNAVTTAANQAFTPIGAFLRRWKIDELPQLLNVLAGDMSLVGPRPKMPEHIVSKLPCRPGITGAATIAFAREEAVLDQVPEEDLESFYHEVVLPAKRRLDARYMARATFLSDLKLIVKSALRSWDGSFLEDLLNTGTLAAQNRSLPSGASDREATFLSSKTSV